MCVVQCIYPMEFESLQMDLRRLQSETDDLKRADHVYFAIPYDQVEKFASKLHNLCDALKYITVRSYARLLTKLKQEPRNRTINGKNYGNCCRC